MVVQKGKQGTRGQKQILQENIETLAFYRNMIAAVASFYATSTFFLSSNLYTVDYVLLTLCAIVLFASFQFMKSMASPTYGEDKIILDEGCDLNMQGGISEHLKDVIILSSMCVFLAIFSSYFWLLWLLAPARGFQLLWVNILAPYIFQPAPEPDNEVNSKKQRKMERKTNRYR